jgi:VCBS repeat-containing protein
MASNRIGGGIHSLPAFAIDDDDTFVPASPAFAPAASILTPFANPPVLGGAGSTDGYTEQAAAIVLEPAITLASPDAPISFGDITISNVQPGDRLTIDGQTSGTYVPSSGGPTNFAYNAATGVLHFNGNTPVSAADTQTMLRLIKFDSTSDNPDDYGTAPTRTILWSVSPPDSTHLGPSNTVSTTVDITAVDDPAVARNDSFYAGATAAIGSGLSLFADNGFGADNDPDNLTVSIALVNGSAANLGHQITLASGALLTVNADGTFVYDPNHAFDGLSAGAFASDSFTYGLSGGSSATVTITLDNNGGSATTYTGTAGNDVIHGNNAGDLFDMTAGGNDAVFGGSTNDGFKFGANYTAADRIDGGGGANNQIQLDGDYSAGITLGGSSITNIQVVALMPGHNYTISTTDDLVAAGQVFTFWSASMTSANHVSIDGHLETDGRFQFFLGAGNDTATGSATGHDVFFGGDGQDTLTGNGGSNVYLYTAVSNSTGTHYDIVPDFVSGSDKFDLPGTVTGVDTRLNAGTLSTASFDTDLAAAIDASHLAAQHAVIFAPGAGTLSGHAFLIVDANGVAGYQAGQDYVMDVTGGITGGTSNSATVQVGDFI